MSTTIGIIGGADGPTAIFVTGNPLPVILGLTALVILAIFALWFFRKKK